MTHPLPNPDEEAERQMMIPAGATINRGTADWLGRMPTRAVPLTDSAIKAWIKSGCLTPYGYEPQSERVSRILWGFSGLVLIATLGAAFTWSLWGR